MCRRSGGPPADGSRSSVMASIGSRDTNLRKLGPERADDLSCPIDSGTNRTAVGAGQLAGDIEGHERAIGVEHKTMRFHIGIAVRPNHLSRIIHRVRPSPLKSGPARAGCIESRDRAICGAQKAVKDVACVDVKPGNRSNGVDGFRCSALQETRARAGCIESRYRSIEGAHKGVIDVTSVEVISGNRSRGVDSFHYGALPRARAHSGRIETGNHTVGGPHKTVHHRGGIGIRSRHVPRPVDAGCTGRAGAWPIEADEFALRPAHESVDSGVIRVGAGNQARAVDGSGEDFCLAVLAGRRELGDGSVGGAHETFRQR